MTNYNGKEVLNGLLFIKSMMSVENVERQAIALRKLATPITHLIFHFIFIKVKNADLMRNSTASISSNVTLFMLFSKTLVAN